MVTVVAGAVVELDEESDEDRLETLDEDESSPEAESSLKLDEPTVESSLPLDCVVEDLVPTTGSEAIKDCTSVLATRAFWEDAYAGVDWLRNANPR